MFASNHVVAGAAIGLVARTPADAFAAGLVSHLAMDSLHHWGRVPKARFLQVARVDGLSALALTGALVWVAPPARRKRVFAGITGAVMPDLDKPASHLLGIRQLWPARFSRFHARLQMGKESPEGMAFEVKFCLVGAAVTVLLSRLGKIPTTFRRT